MLFVAWTAHLWTHLAASYRRHLTLCWLINLPFYLIIQQRHPLKSLLCRGPKELCAPNVMAQRRRRQLPSPDHSDRHAPNTSNNLDHLAFKYMEMCKVESSTDSDSEISPRWSDTSTVGCVSSAPESETLRLALPLTHKPAGRHGCDSLFLDPYDGSSEDSEESNVDTGVSSRRTRQQGKGGGGGGCRFSGRSRRFILHHPAPLRDLVTNGVRDPVTEQQQHLLDVQMKFGSDSELWVCELDILPSHSDGVGGGDIKEAKTKDSTMHTQTMDIDVHCQFDDSGLHGTRSSIPQIAGPAKPVEESSSQMPDSSSERSPSPCNPGSLYKRKLGFPDAEVVELGQRKRQCVINMED